MSSLEVGLQEPRSPASSQSPTVPGRCVPSAGSHFHLPGNFLALALWLCLIALAPGEALNPVLLSEVQQSRCGGQPRQGR